MIIRIKNFTEKDFLAEIKKCIELRIKSLFSEDT